MYVFDTIVGFRHFLDPPTGRLWASQPCYALALDLPRVDGPPRGGPIKGPTGACQEEGGRAMKRKPGERQLRIMSLVVQLIGLAITIHKSW